MSGNGKLHPFEQITTVHAPGGISITLATLCVQSCVRKIVVSSMKSKRSVLSIAACHGGRLVQKRNMIHKTRTWV